ncbi:hypothetical protein [Antarctobacter sp.]|uniref:hypothetical protein n=1 Tax=Antarctobacter sp. TaxID=1872577 RepID=UPI002B2680B3|nr:hypothetical protein [Antarctobacter sp.]
MQNKTKTEATLSQSLLALTEFPTVSFNWLTMLTEILTTPAPTPKDGEALARIAAGFQADIERAERNGRAVREYIQAAMDMQKGPLQ